MKKAIETIWKEGFLNEDALVVPTLNNLYNRKSIHLVDKYMQMFKWNIWLVFAGSILLLGLTVLVRIPLLGILLFFMLQYLVYVDRYLFQNLKSIDKNTDCYSYLKKLEAWLRTKTKTNAQIARYMYPYIFFSIVCGFWFMRLNKGLLGEYLVQTLLEIFPNMLMIWNLPVAGITIFLAVIILLYFYGSKIYQWDVQIVYGDVLAKIQELIADMEQLRKQSNA